MDAVGVEFGGEGGADGEVALDGVEEEHVGGRSGCVAVAGGEGFVGEGDFVGVCVAAGEIVSGCSETIEGGWRKGTYAIPRRWSIAWA